ncbi:MAG: hypothetical protein ABJO86_13160 [Lentilitoribacter sp.]
MKVVIVNSKQASGFVEQVLRGKEDILQKDARQLIRVFHEKHIGIPPNFALDIVSGFAKGMPVDSSNPVRLSIYNRLLDAVNAHDAARQNPTRFDVLPRHIIIEVCIHPLTTLIIEELQELYLFSRDSNLNDINEHDYEKYVEKFNEIFALICKPVSDQDRKDEQHPSKTDLFWERVVHQLWAEVLKRRRKSNRHKSALLSQSALDSLSLRMICGLEPEPDIDLGSDNRKLELADEQNPEFKYPKQGGVHGIHTTSRLEDLEDMLVSELTVPRPLLVDKLLNGAYLAKHRPPPFDERRQIALLGIAADTFDCQEAVALAKSSWLDAIFRISIVLFKNNLLKSEARFGQFIPEAGISSSKIQICSYPHLGKLDPDTANRAQMRRFFSDAGWLPNFLSVLPNYTSQPMIGDLPKVSADWIELLQFMSANVFPEARDLHEHSNTQFGKALLVSFRKVADPVESSLLSSISPDRGIPIIPCVIDCPTQLTHGSSFVYTDLDGKPSEIRVNNDETGSVSKDELERISAQITTVIFNFYWDNANG